VAVGVGKDQAIRFPRVAGPLAILLLLCPACVKDFDQAGRQRTTCFVLLRWMRSVPAAFVSSTLFNQAARYCSIVSFSGAISIPRSRSARSLVSSALTFASVAPYTTLRRRLPSIVPSEIAAA
jgi:hypothetical protein